MPIATNPDSGDVVYLGDDGAWKPAKRAVNPQTREMVAFDGKDWQPVTTHGHGILNYVDDAVRAIASGMTFGYADEISAKMDELTGRGGTYAQNLAKEQARDEKIPSAIKIPGEIAGGVASAVATAPITGAVSAATGIAKLPAAARAIIGGAAAGGLYGSGDAQPGAENRLVGAGIGAGEGAILAPLFLGLTRVAQNVFQPGKRATADLLRAMERDGDTQQGLAQKLQTLQQTRPQATLADVGGENVRGLLERVAQTPGAGRTTVVPFLTGRQTSQLSRISGDLKSLSGTQKTSIDAVEQKITERGKNAAPLYEKAFNEGDKPIWSNELERLSAVPEVQNAMRGAVSGWQRTQIANGYGAMNPGAMVDEKSGGILKFLNGKVPVFPNLQFWDYTKNSLDDMIAGEIRPDGSMSKKGRDLTIIVGKMRDELDKAVPQYAQAREAWAGPSSYINAINLGKSFRKVAADEVAATMAKLSGADKEAYRIGALSSLFQSLGNKGARLDDITNELRSPEIRGKISQLMPTAQAAAKWNKILEFESGSSDMVGRSLKGSPTARRLLESQDADSIVGDLVMDAFKGSPPVSLFAKVLSSTAGRVRDTVRSRTDAEIAKQLTIGRPSVLGP